MVARPHAPGCSGARLRHTASANSSITSARATAGAGRVQPALVVAIYHDTVRHRPQVATLAGHDHEAEMVVRWRRRGAGTRVRFGAGGARRSFSAASSVTLTPGEIDQCRAMLLSDLPQNRTWDYRVARAGFGGL